MNDTLSMLLAPAPDAASIGYSASHGCIRMRNRDLVELFDRVGVDTPVMIKA